MRLRIILGTVLGALLWLPLSVCGQAGSDSVASAKGIPATPTNNTLWIIPHTHWEGAVFKTREEYLEIGLPHILTALELLKTHPEYRFVLDQVAYVKPFLERYPEQEAVFRHLVSEGKLEIVGANDVMLDVNMPGGESWIRQALYGKTYYREKLGVDVTVGWALDTFGHHAQMPQLLKLAGYKSYWFQRGVHSNNTPSEFLWEGIDGSRIPAFWLPLGYGMFYPTPNSLFEFDRYARQQWDALGNYSRWPERVAVAGADVIEPEEALPIRVGEFNADGKKLFTMRFGEPTDFESVVAQRPPQPVVSGELNPVFQGVYSARIELKQWMRSLERILATAEKLSALASWLGFPADNSNLTRAWEPVLFNQAHDLASGTMVDKVYEDTIRGYQFSKSLGEEMVETNIDALASQIDTRSEGIPVVVFNPLGWSRSDLAEVDIGFSEAGNKAVDLTGPSGEAVPIQYIETERYSDGGIKHAKIAFIARDVPGIGYSLYQATPKRVSLTRGENRTAASARPSSTMHEDFGSIENEYYRATFNLWTGEMTKLQVKSGDWEALGGRPANVVAREQDGGDFWELYGTLNGGRLTAMTRKQGLPAPESTHFSNEWVGGDGRTEEGPVFSEFHISHPFGDGSFQTTVRLYPGIRRIDVRTEILNNEKFVRYRVLFPTSLKSGQRFDEIPFGAIERPLAQEFPAQNWSDYSDGTKGVALINRALPGNNVADGTLMLSLMRSARISAYPFFGGYEPGVSSDLGLELGVKRTFDYALLPHEGDWRNAEIYRAGWEFNNPLTVRKVSSHAGRLPKRWGLLEVSQPGVVVSALKPGRGGSIVLRVYEAAGRPSSSIKIKLNVGVSSAREVNLLEEGGAELKVVDDTLQFDLGPYQIKTFSLTVRPLNEGM
jgi:alpha-mannosidase